MATGSVANGPGQTGGGKDGGRKPGDGARVLSVQSWVAHGFVGNRCASLALQVLGADCDAVNSVSLSNHTGYASAPGHSASPEELQAMFDALETNGLASRYTHLLTGYVRSPDALRVIGQFARKLKESHQRDRQQPQQRRPGDEDGTASHALQFVCDPVLGDHGKLYVPPECVTAVQEHLLPVADCIFPNQTEAELLAGRPLRSMVDEATAWAVIDQLHGLGPSCVIVTSAELASEPDHIQIYGSLLVKGNVAADDERAGDQPARRQRFHCRVAKLEAKFTGTGDLLSALLLIWLRHLPNDPAEAVRRSLSSLHAVMQRTLRDAAAGWAASTSAAGGPPPELRLVQSLADIENPPPPTKNSIEIVLL